MEQKFNDLLKQGNELRPKVLAQAEKAYLENPKDQTLRALMLAAVETMVKRFEQIWKPPSTRR